MAQPIPVTSAYLLDARANGRISFAYFDTTDPKSHEYLELGVDQGVLVTETGPLRYNVSYAGKTVTFLLNDISQQPPDGLPLLPSEHFVGRTFDESGLRFLLLYDDDADRFIWILDPGENLPLRPVPFFDELSFDMRTSFVFYRDGQLGRSVLAGVDLSNVMANNYFDGPFDQLPDNHIEETSFAEYVAKAYPGTKGLLNRRGESPDGASRLAITPYSQYRSVQEVASRLDICKSAAKEDRAILYSCMFHDYKSAAPLPEAR